MSNDSTPPTPDGLLDWGDIPAGQSDPYADLLHLAIKHDECAERWATTAKPAIDAFPENYRPVATAILQSWLRDRVRLTRKGYIATVEALELNGVSQKKIKRIEIGETAWNRVEDAGAYLKPADFPAYAAKVEALALERAIRAKRMEVAEAIGKGADANRIRQLLQDLDRLTGTNRRLTIRNSKHIAPNAARPPTIIDGLLRKGEIANVVSGPKMRKSWAVADLAHAASTGGKWLGHFPCHPTKVLLIDNELQQWQSDERFLAIRKARQIPDDAEGFDYVNLRDENELTTLDDLCEMLEGRTEYGLVILDALYRFFPDGFDENSNGDFTRLYNRLARLAKSMDAAIVIVHHTSKGSQIGKSTTDMGSGAGAQSRAADAQIVLRPTQDKDAPEDAPETAVLTAVVRSFAPVGKVHLQWDHPVWQVTTPPPEEVSTSKPPTSLTTLDFAHTYTRVHYESRATIEERARAGGVTHRRARELFEGAVAEKLLEAKVERDGRQTTKLYRLMGASEADFLAN